MDLYEKIASAFDGDIKRAAAHDMAALYGVPEYEDDLLEGVGPNSLQEDPSPEMEEARVDDGVRRSFEALGKLEQAGSSRMPDPGVINHL
jgi:hypothetical protein